MRQYDVIWIGTGQAAGTAIPRLAKAGKRVAVIEGGRFGGSCVNYGCTPTKTLVASARVAHMARRSGDFGVIIPDFTVDFTQVMARQNQIRTSWSDGLERSLDKLDGVELYRAYGEFESDRVVRAGDDRLTGETIVIHTGARARNPGIPGLDEVNWLDNVRLLDLQTLPEHLVVIGGSYIGLEFGQLFRRLGSSVTILEGGPQLMFREDEDVAQIALDVLRSEGIDVCLNARIERVAATDGGGVAVRLDQNGETRTVMGSHLLAATGRVPNTERLNLAAAGVEQTERGFIPVNERLQTNVPHIYAVGDVNRRGAFTHTSVNDGEIFWDAYSGGTRKVSDRIMIYAMYIDPPLGRVGMSEKEARQSGRNILMATRPMSAISRAIEKDETAGLVKILVDAESEQIVGATVFGIGGDEIISLFAPLMMGRLSYRVLRRTVLPHPTVAELMPWILDDLAPLA